MLNNSAASQGDNFPGLGYSQYGQSMTSALNNPQTAYASSNVHSKRSGQVLHQQSQLQQGLSSARRAGQRQTMPSPYAQYQQGRSGIQLPVSNPPLVRASQALQSQYQLQSGLANRGTLQQPATTAANVRALGQPGHSALPQMSAVHGDVSYGGQGHHVSQRYGFQQPEHQQRANATVASTRLDLSSVQQPVPTSTPTSVYMHHNQHIAVSDSYRTRPSVPPAATAQTRRMLSTRGDHAAGDKQESLLDSSDFPTLGGLSHHTTGQVDAAANGIASLSIHNQMQMGKSSSALDANDFPALSTQGGRLASNYMLQNSTTRTVHVEPPTVPVSSSDIADGRATQVDVRDDLSFHGLKALLPHLRNESSFDTYTTLGGDLSTLGLDLGSNDMLYPSLSSPWATGGRMGEVDVQLPEWFLFERPSLQHLSFSRMTINCVFNIFYIFAGEDPQILAAEELHNREWFFHRTCLFWMKPKKMVKAVHDRLGDCEQGEIEYFDTSDWAIKSKQDFYLDRRCIEDSPSQYAANQRQAQR